MTTTDREFRLRSPARIAELFAEGLRVSDRRVTLIGLPNELPLPRLALAVGKRHGSAVRRNRVKRMAREAFRAVRGQMPPGWDLVVLPRPGPAHTVADLADSLLRLSHRLQSRRPGSPT